MMKCQVKSLQASHRNLMAGVFPLQCSSAMPLVPLSRSSGISPLSYVQASTSSHSQARGIILIIRPSMQIDTTLCGGWCRDTYTSLGCGIECAERIPDPRNYDSEHLRVKRPARSRPFTHLQMLIGLSRTSRYGNEADPFTILHLVGYRFFFHGQFISIEALQPCRMYGCRAPCLLASNNVYYNDL